MKIRIISVGRVRESYLLEGEAEYLKRFGNRWQVAIEEVPNEKFASLPVEQLKQKEGESVIAKLAERDFVVALDEHGRSFTSVGFSKIIERECVSGRSDFVFAIGGAHGWHKNVKARANLLLSLSEMTLPYQVTRLVLVEQLYRAFTLLHGTPYHK